MLTTLRTSLGSYATLGLCLLGFGSAWSGVAYAFGFCVPLALLIYGPPTESRTTVALVERIARQAHRMRFAVAVLMLAAAGAVVV
jgi:nitrate reductase NapE component